MSVSHLIVASEPGWGFRSGTGRSDQRIRLVDPCAARPARCLWRGVGLGLRLFGAMGLHAQGIFAGCWFFNVLAYLRAEAGACSQIANSSSRRDV